MWRKNRKADGKAEMKYKEAYDAGVSRLKEAGVEEAALDARLLLEHICHTNRNDLLAHGDRKLGEDLCSVYFEGIARRESRVPLQHITGEQDFMGLVFERLYFRPVSVNNHRREHVPKSLPSSGNGKPPAEPHTRGFRVGDIGHNTMEFMRRHTVDGAWSTGSYLYTLLRIQLRIAYHVATCGLERFQDKRGRRKHI